MSFTEAVDDVVAANENGLLGAHATWCRVPLESVCRVLNGFPFSSTRFNKIAGLPLLRIRDVLRGWTDTRYDGEHDSEYLVRRGELVVGMDGDFNCALWRGKTALLNQRVCKLTPNERFYDLRFLAHVLPGYLEAINRRTPAITVKHLSSKTVEELPLPLPPRAEQTRLAEATDSYLTRLDDAIATLERVQRNLKRYRASVLKAAVEGRLEPTEAELARAEGRDYEPASVLLERILAERRRRWEEAELARMKAKGKTPRDDKWKLKYAQPATPDTLGFSELPEGWCWASLDQLAQTLDGGTSASASSQPSPRRVLRSSAVRQGFVDVQDVRYLTAASRSSDDPYIRSGDLLITRLSGTLEYVANCAVVAEDSPQQLEFPDRIFRGRLLPSLSPRLIQHWFAVPSVRRPLEKAARSTAGHQRVSLSDLRRLAVPLPPSVS